MPHAQQVYCPHPDCGAAISGYRHVDYRTITSSPNGGNIVAVACAACKRVLGNAIDPPQQQR